MAEFSRLDESHVIKAAIHVDVAGWKIGNEDLRADGHLIRLKLHNYSEEFHSPIWFDLSINILTGERGVDRLTLADIRNVDVLKCTGECSRSAGAIWYSVRSSLAAETFQKVFQAHGLFGFSSAALNDLVGPQKV
jgi:hypothetical protein